MIYELLMSLRANLSQTDITLYAGASEQLIYQFEREMNLILPADFKAFYLFCNGFESEDDMFRMIPLEEILERKQELPSHQFYVAEYLIYCDMWEVELSDQMSGKYRIHNMNITLTDSIVEFLNRFLQGGVFEAGGLYDWRQEAIRSKS
ncbi:SMI1/KNR4 family protein [Hymenobacter puniceus]|uniref:SMI1/KNR4 family protein n=1 Tax=Hymenobacter sp. BT190 TaxID=2763505 RepID=UPI0016519C62|nr:SMI1/KNR4 family protein [Hymenobacter sp. BT190]MBC6698676.1 SMI1/KNR4 family protein [Hymenobacter sp. BT190]